MKGDKAGNESDRPGVESSGATSIDDEKKETLKRGAILAFSLVVHAVVFYFALTLKIDVKIIDFGGKTTRVVIVPPPPIAYKASAPEGTGRPVDTTVAAGTEAAAVPPSGGGLSRAGEEGGVTAGGTGAPPGGTTGETLGGSGRAGGGSVASGFSLVYPADAMLNLSVYARVPEDAWLRPLRELAEPKGSFSRYLHPPGGTREAASKPASGGKGIARGTGTLKPLPPGVVAAFVPESVRAFDLSAWAAGVLNAVQRSWTLGSQAWEADWSGRVAVTVLVMKNGERNGVDVAASSNIDLLDASALRAIERGGPWPALPDDFPGTSLEIQLVFQYGL